MVERRERLDAVGKQFLDQAVVKIETVWIRSAHPLGEYARPGDGEAVGCCAELLHQSDVFLEAVVVVAGDIGDGAVPDDAGGMAERVPDRCPAAVFSYGALDLVGRGRRPPKESVRKA